MPTQNPQRRRIRLAAEVYAERGMICSIPIAVKGRAPVSAGVAVDAWCVVPGHVHLIGGASATCDIVTFVGPFKHMVQREAWRRGIKGAFW